MNENGNKDTRTFSGQREALAGAIYRVEGLKMYPEKIQRAHNKGLIHLHDLDRSPFSSLPNCSLPDFSYLLEHGFTLGNAHITTPQSIGVAANLIANLFATISGEQFGGISVHEIDRVLEPYAEKTLNKNRDLYREVLTNKEDVETNARKKTVKDIYDAMQTLEYQVNTMASNCSQVPFTTISFGQTTTWLGREIQKAILRVRRDGMDGQTAIFPKLLFFVDDGINKNPEDPNYDIKQLAMECSRKRIYPDMISAPRIRELKDGDLITAMGCRSFLHPWRRNGVPEIVGRNNIGVVTINIPHIAIHAEHNTDLFFDRLRSTTNLTLDALHVREESVLNADVNNAPIMYTQGGLGNPEGKICVRDFYTGENEKRSSISVGYIGIHNAMTSLTGDKNWQKNPTHRDTARRILDVIQDEIDKRQHEFHAMVTIYATPSESLCDRFDTIDATRFGEIDDVNDRGYYENSFHFPSYMDTDPFTKIRFESTYMDKTPGGFMFYVEAPALNSNPQAFESLWDEAYDHVGYFGVNTPIDSCFVCDFEGEFSCDDKGYHCPQCGNRDPEKASVTRRLCGYLGSPMKRPVVQGKNKEINSRVKHM